MKKATLLLFSLLLTAMVLAQDTETRSLSDFDEISVATGISATLVSGSKNEIKISAKGIELEDVKSEVDNGKLVLRIKKKWNNWGFKRSNVTATITYSQELDGISSSSGASVKSDNSIISDNIELDASSGSSIDVDVQCQEVRVDISSGARIKTHGSTTELAVDMSSGSSYKGYGLAAKNASIKGSSGANAQITVSNTLEAAVSSGSNVKYKGNPVSKDINKSSGASVRSVDDNHKT